jgi:hypothetical protein
MEWPVGNLIRFESDAGPNHWIGVEKV